MRLGVWTCGFVPPVWLTAVWWLWLKLELLMKLVGGSVALPVCSQLALITLLVDTSHAGPGLFMSHQDQRELACRSEPRKSTGIIFFKDRKLTSMN
jgi:hypothetical protein